MRCRVQTVSYTHLDVYKRQEYNEYYPYDGMEGSYYSVFVETDLNKASTIDGQRLLSLIHI